MTVNLNACFQQWPLGWEFQIQNVELVVHWGVPKSVLCYWQEVGRAEEMEGVHTLFALLMAGHW